MSELTTATEIALVDMTDGDLLALRKAGSAGLWKLTLGRFKTRLLGSTSNFVDISGAADGDILMFDSGDNTFKPVAPSGGTVGVEEEGSTVTGGPFSTLNFVGAGVTASDLGGGVAEVNIPGGGGGGGGGAGIIGWPLFTMGSSAGFGAGYFGGRYIVVPEDGNITHIGCFGVGTYGATTVRPGVYSVAGSGPAFVHTTLLEDGPTVTGILPLVNLFPLTAPLAVLKGDVVFVGLQISGTGTNFPICASGGETSYFASTGALAGTAPATAGNLSQASFFACMG